jgi:hypothetical protein
MYEKRLLPKEIYDSAGQYGGLCVAKYQFRAQGTYRFIKSFNTASWNMTRVNNRDEQDTDLAGFPASGISG